jgi:hypothetical protein
MKYLLIISLLFISACKDQAVKTKTDTVTRTIEPVCPPGEDDYPDPPTTVFNGIKNITDIGQTKLTVHWDGLSEASAYMVLQREPGEKFKVVHTRNAPGQRAIISNLKPNTTYEFTVRFIDSRGLYDLNETVLSATTSAWPIYTNGKSLALNGIKSVRVAPSEELAPGNTFTFSVWVKSSDDNQNDGRIFTMHKSSGASSAIYLSFDKKKVLIGYRNADDDLKKERVNQNLADSFWHHIVLTYNNRFYVLYIDGVMIKRFEDSFIGMGTHPAHIGSYTGSQKAMVGNIDEVSFWSSALGATDAVDIYNSGAPYNILRHRRANTLMAWYRMGDDNRDNASVIYDQAGEYNADPVNVRISDYVSESP